MRIMLAADIGVTVVTGGAAIVWAVTSNQPSVRMLATWVWMTLIAALALSLAQRPRRLLLEGRRT